LKKTSKSVDHFKLLCDFGELNWIFTNSEDIDSFLHKIVSMVARHMNVNACTIFLYDNETEELVLRATEGLSPDCVGKVRLEMGEGLTGLALQRLEPICVENPSKHPHFKSVHEIDEEKYKSFLSVPITRGISKIGVLTLHRDSGGHFSEEDVNAIRVIASQLANIIESAGLLLQLSPDAKPSPKQKRTSLKGQTILKGMSASDGTVAGKAFVLDRMRSFSQLLETEFEQSFSAEEFKAVLLETEKQMNKLQEEIEEKLDNAASLIFTSHLLILKDQIFIDEVMEKIEGGENPPRALLDVARRYIDIFTHSTNPYVQEKVKDVEDVVLRILANLDRKVRDYAVARGRVAIARELYPSDILTLSSEGARGIVQVSGGITSHVAILARSLQIPMIIVDNPQLMNIPPGTTIIMDGDSGSVYINPHPDAVASFRERIRTLRHIKRTKPDVKPETYTRDGTRVRLMANINLFSDLKLSMDLNAEGVGLYRTEFPFLIRGDFPTEAEQYVIYRRIVENSSGKEITFRTLDIGGDKIMSYFEDYHEPNPFLGLRSIRFSLQNRDLFEQQLRAILQACCDAPTRIMFPMISSLDEFREAKDILFECRQELIAKGIEIKEQPKVGMMVEVPSLVAIMEDLVKEADFFSIGTNDLIQYILGVDRTNEKVADHYLPHHPSVLRSIKRIVDVARAHDKEVAVCGAMGHQERYVPFLLGIGIRILSMNAMYLSRIQKLIIGLDIKEATELAEAILTKGSIRDVETLLSTETTHRTT
jgi:phosphotransferase system enzyme I (PtsP)